MIPLMPFSVRLTDEERSNQKALAELVDRSENQINRKALKILYNMVYHHDQHPEFVEEARFALRKKEHTAAMREISCANDKSKQETITIILNVKKPAEIKEFLSKDWSLTVTFRHPKRRGR